MSCARPAARGVRRSPGPRPGDSLTGQSGEIMVDLIMVNLIMVNSIMVNFGRLAPGRRGAVP